MAESKKRASSKKPGGRARPPRPGKNSEGTRKKGSDGKPKRPAIPGTSAAGAANIMDQLAGGLGAPPPPPPGAGAMGPPGAPPTAMEPPPTPSPPVPPGVGGPPGMGGPAGTPPLAAPPGGPPMPVPAPPPGPGQASGALPQMAGAGMPSDMQGMPGDQQALLQQMQTGFGPGASDADFDAGMNAAAQARAAEQMAMQQAFTQTDDQMQIAELGRLLAEIMSRRQGQPPGPANAAGPGGMMPR